MVNRIDQTFRRLKRARKKGLIAYITAGFPTRASFQRLVPLLQQSGVDLLEIGVPFSDPIADGPTIQHSSQIALRNGATLSWILRETQSLRRRGVSLPLVLMSYANPIHAMGVESFFRAAQKAGIDGLIVPDIIPEEGSSYERAAKRFGLSLIYLVAPTTPKTRLRYVASRTKGFLYAVSLTGVTGARRALPSQVQGFLTTVRSSSRVPLAVGFGLSTTKQVREISRSADAVIVGSALIKEIEKSKSSGFKSAARFIHSLKGALNAS